MILENGSLLLDRYRILGLIRKGGMGAVYRATDLRLGNTVAVKQNILGLGPGARPIPHQNLLQSQFDTEAALLASLHHPGLPRVIDYFTIEEDGQYLVMDFIDGEDLDKPLQRKLIYDEREAIQILIEICGIVEYLHSRTPHPVIHRDIKPGNIRRTAEGFRLVDFGIAKFSTGDRTVFEAHTPGYAPPEQHSFNARTDERSDIYALGATLFGMLTGGPPTTATARKVDGSLEALAVRLPRATPELREIIRKAMRLDPWERYQTATGLKEALEEQIQSTERQPVRPRAREARTFVLRPPSRVVTSRVVTVVLLGAACLGGLLWFRGDDAGAPRLDPVAIRTLSVAPDGADLGWTPSAAPGFLSYEVHVSSEREFRPSIATRYEAPLTTPENTRKIISGLTCETHYFFRIRVNDRLGRYADSRAMEAVTGTCRKTAAESVPAPNPVDALTTLAEKKPEEERPAITPNSTGSGKTAGTTPAQPASSTTATPVRPAKSTAAKPARVGVQMSSVRAISTTSMELQWTGGTASGIVAIEVHASRAPAFLPSPQTLRVTVSEIHRTSATVTDLECDTPYTFRLRVRTEDGKTVDSKALSGRTPACEP